MLLALRGVFAADNEGCPIEPAPAISLMRKCCAGSVQGPITAEPLELLRALSASDAERVQAISDFLLGKTAPILDEEDLDFLVSLGLAVKTTQKVVRPGNVVYFDEPGYLARNFNRTYERIAAIRCGTSEVFPRDAYPASTKGKPAKVWPYRASYSEPAAGTYAWCSVRDLWVEEDFWIVFPQTAKPLVVGASPGGPTNPTWYLQPIFLLPSDRYNVDYFFKSLTQERITSELEFGAFALEFSIGLIPFVGSGVQLVDGLQTGEKADIVLGTAGFVGDMAGGVPGLIADACKASKLAPLLTKGACIGNLVSRTGTIVLVTKNFLDGNGTGIQAGMASIALTQLLATLVLNIKHKNIDVSKLKSLASTKVLDLAKMRCAADAVPVLKKLADCESCAGIRAASNKLSIPPETLTQLLNKIPEAKWPELSSLLQAIADNGGVLTKADYLQLNQFLKQYNAQKLFVYHTTQEGTIDKILDSPAEDCKKGLMRPGFGEYGIYGLDSPANTSRFPILRAMSKKASGPETIIFEGQARELWRNHPVDGIIGIYKSVLNGESLINARLVIDEFRRIDDSTIVISRAHLIPMTPSEQVAAGLHKITYHAPDLIVASPVLAAGYIAVRNIFYSPPDEE